MSTLFALDSTTRIVHISEVARGLACNCSCVVCSETVVARQGLIREHHFAHASGREPCDATHESLLHLYAKQVIADAGELVVPMNDTVRNAFGLELQPTISQLLTLADVQEEQLIGAIRPDLIGRTEDGIVLAIELAYTSFCDPDKVSEFEKLAVPVIEVDISRFSPEGFEPNVFRASLLTQLEGKQWLWPQEADPQPSCATPESSPPRMEAVALSTNRLPEEIITISDRWVSIKQLPSGDLAVRVVRYDPDVVSLVKNLARANQGSYSPRWKSWNIPRWRADGMREALRRKSTTVSIRLHDSL